MQTRQLGNTDLHLSEIGFGAWAVGGPGWEFGWGEQDDHDSIAAIHAALDHGINWIDTAAVYGLGHSEEVVARALKNHSRNDVIIATKCSLVWDDKGTIGNDLSAASVRRECEASLRRLNTDHIDLYQIHWPNDDEHIEEGWAEIGRLIEEGKVRYGGVSNFLVSHLERAHAIHPVSSLQPPYSMLRRFIEDAELGWCAANGCGVVAYSPMQAGLLTDNFATKTFDDEDWRNRSAEHQEPNRTINIEFIEALKPIAGKYGKNVVQLALAWVLRRPELTSAIAGARRPDQIAQSAGGAGWQIDADDLATIEELLTNRMERVRDAGGHLIEVNR